MTSPYQTVSAPRTVYRVTRGFDPLALPAWDHVRTAERGRYDDPLDVFRVLYASTSKIGAVTEVLADLRPRFDRIGEAQAIEGDAGAFDELKHLVARTVSSMNERLLGRYLATLRIVDPGPVFVDLGAGTSRGRIEYRFGGGRLKVGQFTGRDRALARTASRAIFDEGHSGLVMPSAECSHAHTVAVFETGHETNRLRARMEVVSLVPAATGRKAVAAAIRSLLGSNAFSALVLPELLDPAC